ncbi:hypothetical protein BJY01DRAFT_246640 [Aspergillus pseudoustus]|uniref:Major facilitator superfamily (MFS) profile domain-containing protein n=1 Tax=Aspergillus pseudoustus TaxID=1810923 RepID=A0ABR4K6D4_9EURO
MNVRVQAVGMCSQMEGVASIIFQQFFPKFYENEGLKSFFLFFMTCNMFLTVFVWFMIPETKKVLLEEMDTLFGGPSHVQSGVILLQQSKEGALVLEPSRGEKEEVEFASVAAGAPAVGEKTEKQ